MVKCLGLEATEMERPSYPLIWQAGPSVGCPVLAVLSHELGAHLHELTLAMTGKIMWTILV